jgi:cyclophilin family peptidyl-prolyl cis-trans isomerase
MAKTAAPNTGGSQFFLIPEDSEPDHLNGVHTVFGKIVSGCTHVTAVSEIPTTGSDGPVNTVQLKNAYIVV